MRTLDEPAKALIAVHSVGCVATIDADGGPAVSPKATFLVLDAETLAFAEIRSPGTLANLDRDARVEVNFIDPFRRVGYRVAGSATFRPLHDVTKGVRDAFRSAWPDLFASMHGIVTIRIGRVERVESPSYDNGADAASLADHWFRRFADELGYTVRRKM